MSTFYIVATPIGNLEDITLRAIRILKEVDLILCEDTRVTQRLLKHYGITGKKLGTYNDQKSGINAGRVFESLNDGKNIALVSDAGTPGISDPGVALVGKIKDEFGDSVKIESVPGPSALTAALSVAGLPVHDFVFLGFLPHKKGRETIFREIEQSERTVIFYESPHRILKTLESLVKFVPGKDVAIARELTKIHEEVIRGTPEFIRDHFNKNKDTVRGEFVVMVSSK